MATFSGNSSGFSVYDGKEILEVQAWGDNSARVRSTLRPAITETPGSALEEPRASRPHVEVSDGRALMRNGDLVVEVTDSEGKDFLHFPPLVRFLRPDGEELLSERPPTSVRLRRGGTGRQEATFIVARCPSEPSRRSVFTG